MENCHSKLGVSLNGGIPISHPKMIIFSRKTNGFVGETHHFRKPPVGKNHSKNLRKFFGFMRPNGLSVHCQRLVVWLRF